MNVLLIGAIAILCCVFFNQFFSRFSVPMLLIFILLGMAFGTDGIFALEFTDYSLSEQVCSIALIFIMFYGGFGTSWKEARPVAVHAILLSSVGVVLTALFTTLFCYFVLRLNGYMSFLIGAVTSSTDAASVFSILRSKKMGLKNHTASLLELESGSNDPFSYMLTVVAISLMNGTASTVKSILMIFFQLFFGIVIGFGVALLTRFILKKVEIQAAGFKNSFIFGVALFSYSLASALRGNGYLSVYITGIILGNMKMKDKKSVVNFFDGLTSLTQMLIFFLLGLLSEPSKLPSIFGIAFPVVLFLTFVSRPLAVLGVLLPFKCKLNQQALVSWAGLRGASSIVFAIMSINSFPEPSLDLFHVVFCLVLVSIVFQGSFLSPAAKLLGMNDENSNILKTFSDYTDESDLQFITIDISENNPWMDKKIMEINLPPDTLIVTIIRGKEHLIPHGLTVLKKGDTAVLAAKSFNDDKTISLTEVQVNQENDYAGKKIMDLSLESDELIVTIIRGGKNVIPKGNTLIHQDDILVINKLSL